MMLSKDMQSQVDATSMDLPAVPDAETRNGGYRLKTAFDYLQAVSKIIFKRLFRGEQPSEDEMAAFINAIMVSNSVESE